MPSLRTSPNGFPSLGLHVNGPGLSYHSTREHLTAEYSRRVYKDLVHSSRESHHVQPSTMLQGVTFLNEGLTLAHLNSKYYKYASMGIFFMNDLSALNELVLNMTCSIFSTWKSSPTAPSNRLKQSPNQPQFNEPCTFNPLHKKVAINSS